MESDNLLLTKLSRPRTSRWHLERPHLTQALEAGLSHRLTALIAAAGHGKTTTLAHFLSGRQIPYMWLQLDSGDSDLGTFCRYLSHGIAAELGGGDRLAAMLRTAGPAPARSSLIPVLVQDLTACPPSAIVLDDFHLIERDSPVIPLMADLIHYLPPQVHLYICSRTPLPFATARLKVNQEAAEIREDDLRFTPGEVRTYIRQMAEIDMDDFALEQICHLTEGWSAALVLLAATLRRRGSVDAILKGGLPSDLFSYLADEVLAGLDEPTRSFLEESSVLDTCTPEACDQILGRCDSAERLGGLSGSHLLITQVGPDSYRYHHLFQRFLQERLRLRAHGELFRDLHRRAGDWFLEKQMPEEGVRHYLRGGHLDKAAGLVETLVPVWLRTNRMDRLRALLALLPAEMKEQYPWISLCEARQQQYAGNADQALGMARLALGAFTGRGDLRGQVQALLIIGTIHADRQQHEEASAAYAEAAARLTPDLRYEEAVLLECRALHYLTTRGVDLTVEGDLRRALAIYIETGDLAGEAKISEWLGMVRLRLGDFRTAIQMHERSAGILKSLGEPSYEIGLNQAFAYLMCGRFRDAAAILEPMVASSSRKIRRAFAARYLVEVYARQGEFQKAAAMAQQAHALVEELGHRELRAQIPAVLSTLYRLSGQGEAAIPYAQEALQLARGIERLDAYLRVVLEAIYLHLFHTGNAAAARRMAEKALARVTGESERWEWMLLTLCSAVAAFRQARTESRPEAVQLLNEGLTECSRRGYAVFALHEWSLALTVAIYGLAYQVQPRVCLELIQLMTAHLPPAVRNAGVTLAEPEAKLIPAAWQGLPDDAARQNLAGLLSTSDRRRVVNLAAGPLPVRILCLGPLTVSIANQRVDHKALRRRKAGQLLVLLLASEGPLPRDQVLDKLWPDLDADAADTSLRVSIHYLRRLLEPHLGGRGRSRYIQAEGGLVWFSREAEVQIDLDRFRQHMDQAEQAAAMGDRSAAAEHFEAAAQLYRGDLCADDPYAEGLQELRAALRDRYAAALSWLGEYCWEELQDHARAILYYRQRLALDEAHEPTHQALIRLYLETGQVAEARAQFIACREALGRLLGVEPSRSTESLHQLAISMEREAPVPLVDSAPQTASGVRRGRAAKSQ